jgi:ABC-type branched-subunit amino acid transport system substrate-binding protein
MSGHIKSTAAVAVAIAALVAAGCASSSKSRSGAATTVGGTSPSSTATASPGTSGASSGSGAVQGLTASTITLGQLADISGPVPGLFQGAVDGMDAWAAHVNSTGGIDGRKIVIDHKDSELSCSAYTDGFTGFSKSVFAVVGTYSLVDACGEAVSKTNPSFPDLEAVVLNPIIADLPNVYGATPASSGYATTGFQWVKAKYGASAAQHTAGLYSSASTFDFSLQEAAAHSVGYDYVYSREFAPTETNYTSDVLRMKSDNVKIVDLIDLDVEDLADFLQQANQQNFHPDAVLNTTGYDPNLFKLLVHPALAAPLVFSLPYSMYLGEDAASVPEINTLTQFVHQTHPGNPINLFTTEAYTAGLLFQQAMSTLGSSPTQSGLLHAVSQITDFTANGLLSPANVGQKKGQVCTVIVRPENGKFVRLDPPDKGFQCNGTFVYSKTT